MKIAQARKLLTEDIGRMTLEQLQRHRVKLTDAWRESRAEYGMGQAAMDGFYRQTGEDVTEYTPTDLWLTQNLSHRLDETIERELELLSSPNSKAQHLPKPTHKTENVLCGGKHTLSPPHGNVPYRAYQGLLRALVPMWLI